MTIRKQKHTELYIFLIIAIISVVITVTTLPYKAPGGAFTGEVCEDVTQGVRGSGLGPTKLTAASIALGECRSNCENVHCADTPTCLDGAAIDGCVVTSIYPTPTIPPLPPMWGATASGSCTRQCIDLEEVIKKFG